MWETRQISDSTGSTSSWVAGAATPVTEEITAFDLPITGQLPVELDGRLLRNGPNPIGDVGPDYHWFTGAGMVHGIRLGDGAAQWYRNRWVRSRDICERLGETPPPSPFALDTPDVSANTNVIELAGRTYAIVEAGGPPVELGDDLETIGPSDFDGTRDHPYTAHPKVDPATGNRHSISYFWAWGDRVRYEVVGPDGRVRHRADIEVGGPVMVHDMSITERWAIVYDLPCVFDIDAAMSGAALPYRWSSTYRPRLGVLPLGGTADQVRWVDIEPCWVFHPVNAFDDGDTVVIDVVRHDSVFRTDLTGPNEGLPRVERWVIDPERRTWSTQVLDDRPQEFPRVDERRVGRRHRVAYSAEIAQRFTPGAALRHIVDTGVVDRHRPKPGRGIGEAVFVPRSADAEDDDGWVLAIAHHLGGGPADLLVIDTADFSGEPVATIHLPAPVPVGFHGNWIPT